MIGNDVVDLAATGAARHPRFDLRAFTPGERRAIACAASPEETRWAFWAAKEAAHKVLHKIDPKESFVPGRMEVRLGRHGFGRVVRDRDVVPVRVRRSGAVLHAVACDRGADVPAMRWALAPLRVGRSSGDAPDPGRDVRVLAIRVLAARLGVDPEACRIVRRNRIPELWIGDAPAPVDLSLSHHGGWVAFAAELGLAP